MTDVSLEDVVRQMKADRFYPYQIAEKLGLEREEVIRILKSEPRREDGSNRRPLHLENYHRARRGFHVPASKEDQYFALLTAGVPIAEAKRKLRLGEGVGAS